MKPFLRSVCASILIICFWLWLPISTQTFNSTSSNSQELEMLYGLPTVLPTMQVIETTETAQEEDSALAAVIQGDIVIGGLFPVHKKSSGFEPCGGIQEDRGIQRVEAMLFTLDTINNDSSVLEGITLGANILDTCSRDTYALEQSLEYVRASLNTLDASDFECKDGSQASPKSIPMAVAGVIGGSYSSVSIQVANLLRLFKIPQISYASTSAALSDKTRFEYFARTVPPDNFQARAMVDIVRYFNWTYVSTVASEGDYGESGIDSFQQEARASNICIAISQKIPHSANAKTYDNIINRLLVKPNARVVILFLRVEDATNLLMAVQKHNITNHFIWIASDGWGKNEMPVKRSSSVANGAITIELQSTLLPEFDDYFKSLNPFTNIRNPWFKEYWEKVHSCTFEPPQVNTTGLRQCTGEEKLNRRNYNQESKTQFIFDAVYALAIAIDKVLKERCKKKQDLLGCMKTTNLNGTELYKTILNVTFDDGYGGLVQFDHHGDGIGRYNIMNYRRNRATGRYEYVVVGEWVNGLDMIEGERIMWSGGTYSTPDSQCSQPCGMGERKVVQTGDTCCWICTECHPWEYLQDESTCKDCGEAMWPYEDKKSCYRLQEQYMQMDSIFAIVPMCLAALGIIFTSIVIITFVRNINTPIVKASGRELSFVLLVGFLVCYFMSFILIAKPSPFMCGIQRFGVGFGFSMTYASLLTKTNRISRIFDSASKSAKRPAFISPKSQLVITCLFVSVQVICTCVWLILEPPGTRLHYPDGKRNQVILKCKIQDISFLISLVYNMLLIIICTVYAVKTRKIPENFNESKFIGFTMYTTCIIWLAFVPIYFGTLNSFQIQTTTLCVSISLSAFVALLCLFTPKMYIIVFQPQKNVRKLTMNSGTYKKAATSSTMGGMTSNHGPPPPPEQIKLRGSSPHKTLMGGITTETETDRDSMNSLTFDECADTQT